MQYEMISDRTVSRADIAEGLDALGGAIFAGGSHADQVRGVNLFRGAATLRYVHEREEQLFSPLSDHRDVTRRARASKLEM